MIKKYNKSCKKKRLKKLEKLFKFKYTKNRKKLL